MNSKRILITGGAGFIGAHTTALLLTKGYQVVVLDNLSSGTLANLNMSHPQLDFVEGDVLDYFLIEELLKDCDGVLHLAALASVPLSIEEPIYSFQVNVQGLLHVLQAVHKLQQSIRVVYASSAAVYGNALQLPCNDEAPIQGQLLSPYALQKWNDEEYAALYSQIYGVTSLGLRYFNVYGPKQNPRSPYSGVISRFLDAYKNQQEITVFGDGKQSRDFISVHDIARANVLALEHDAVGVMNIATGVPQTLLQLIHYIEQAGNRKLSVVHQAERVGDIKSSYAIIQRAEKVLGFKATISLEDGIREMVKDN